MPAWVARASTKKVTPKVVFDVNDRDAKIIAGKMFAGKLKQHIRAE